MKNVVAKLIAKTAKNATIKGANSACTLYFINRGNLKNWRNWENFRYWKNKKFTECLKEWESNNIWRRNKKC